MRNKLQCVKCPVTVLIGRKLCTTSPLPGSQGRQSGVWQNPASLPHDVTSGPFGDHPGPHASAGSFSMFPSQPPAMQLKGMVVCSDLYCS